MRRRNIKIAILIITAGLVGIFLFKNQPVFEARVESVHKSWSSEIQTIGGEVAYENFAETVRNESVNTQHEKAHEFGGVLYDVLGLEGLKICDDRFLYGCVHEVVGRSIVAQGLQVVKDLDAICADMGEQAIFCQHGIGHGLVAYLGYEERNLFEALLQCDELTDISETGGCYGGVFMEYNLRQMTGSTTVVRENEDVFNPCNELPLEHQPACLYWQSQWWRNGPLRTAGIDEEVFGEMGEYCRIYNGEQAVETACIRGIGNIIAPGVSYDVKTVGELCQAATGGDDVYYGLCITEAAQRTVNASLLEEAEAICEQLVEVGAKKGCLELVR